MQEEQDGLHQIVFNWWRKQARQDIKLDVPGARSVGVGEVEPSKKQSLGIREAKQHNQVLKMTQMSTERSFLFVSLSFPNHVVSVLELQLSENHCIGGGGQRQSQSKIKDICFST